MIKLARPGNLKYWKLSQPGYTCLRLEQMEKYNIVVIGQLIDFLFCFQGFHG